VNNDFSTAFAVLVLHPVSSVEGFPKGVADGEEAVLV
jgi:hypothetical protein